MFTVAKIQKIKTEYRLPVMILKEGANFIAYTPALDLSTQGKTLEEVKQRFSEIVEIFFEELITAGTLPEVLTSLGWRKKANSWQPPVVVENAYETITVKQ